MTRLTGPAEAIAATPRQSHVLTAVFCARALRDFGDGFVAVLLPSYLIRLGFSTAAIGVLAGVALLGSATSALAAGFLGGRFDYRRLLLAGAFLMAATGAALAAFDAYAALLAEAVGMSEAEVEEIRLGAVLHDVGKVGIPEQILNKSGPLNPEEWEAMKTHVTYGGRLLEPLHPLARIRQMVLHHHEFFDGSGYPLALSGKNIPLGARIVTIADSYDTITSDRSYKKGRTAEQALGELERCAGTQFDPELVAPFTQLVCRLYTGVA